MLREEPIVTVSTSPSDHIQASGVSVLVVDDDLSTRMMVRSILLPLGFSIVEADSGQAALRSVMNQDFAVILLDVHMPKMNGFETAAFIRRRQQSEMTPIIFMADHAVDEIGPAARYVEGAVDFMITPLDPVELRAKVSVFADLFLTAGGLARRAREVQASANKLRLLTDAAPIGIFQTDASKRFTYTNPRWAQLTGITSDEASARDWESLISAPDRIGRITELSEESQDDTGASRRFKIELADSAHRIVLVTSESITDPGGGLMGWVGTVADVTAEAAAGEERTRFRALVQNSRSVTAVVDAEGRFTYVSPAVTELTGYDPEELLGQSGFSFIHPDDLEFLTAQFAQLVQGPTDNTTAEVRTRTKKGSWEWIEIRATNRLEEPTLQGIILNYHDVTERRNAQLLEEQLNQSRKMEAVGQLAGGVAHDFNNLLAVILNYAQFVTEELEEASPLLSDVQEIIKAGERAAALVHQLLAFSRKEVVEPRVIDLNEVVRDVQGLLGRSIGEDIGLVFELADDLPFIKVDPGHIEQVLINLAINGRDAMPSGGTLSISTCAEVLTEAGRHGLNPGNYVRLVLEDTGTGMDPDTLERVFEPFFTTKARGVGTGLGLATVYGIVKQANGSVSVVSEEGVGTTFTIYFPPCDENISGAAEPELPTKSEGTETILLVEDEDAVRHLVSRILVKHGYQVASYADASEAFRFFRQDQGSIDLLLTDVIMPGMSGKALSDEATMLHPGLRTLYMSGYTDELIAQRGVLEAGENLISKPFKQDQLLAKVRSLLDMKVVA